MKRTMILVALGAILALNAAAVADMYQTGPVMWEGAPGFGPGDPDEKSLQQVFNDITVGGVSGVDAVWDAMIDEIDSYWQITGSGQSATTMIVEISAGATTTSFGIYDALNPSNRVQIFAGSAAPGLDYGGTATVAISVTGKVYINNAFSGVTFTSGNNFGYYIAPSANTTWFSDTSLNSDQFDHMLAYQGQNEDTIQIEDLAAGLWADNEFALAWEDQANGGDGDWQDLVVMVESVRVPVPGAVLLGVLGLSVAGARLRKRS